MDSGLYFLCLTLADLGDADCIDQYQLERARFQELCELLQQQLQPQTLSRCNSPPLQCILVALSFFTAENLQHTVTTVHGVFQSSASCCLSQFLDIMLQHIDHLPTLPHC